MERHYKVGDRVYITKFTVDKDVILKIGQVGIVKRTNPHAYNIELEVELEEKKGIFSWRYDYIRKVQIPVRYVKLHTPVEKLNKQRLKKLLTKLKDRQY